MQNSTLDGWRSRGYLPHFDAGQVAQSITFRLVDSFPSALLQSWKHELSFLSEKESEHERRKRIEGILDRGFGESWLAQPKIAEIVQLALLHFDAERYRLHAWVIMPNHVHALITPESGMKLGQILHSWKSFTAKKANSILGRTGPFWQEEYFDRYVRQAKHFGDAVAYIEGNPVKAKLCEKPSDWVFSSAAQVIDQDY